MNTKEFDYSSFETEALSKLQSGEPLLGSKGVLTPLIKRIVEASLEGEISEHLSDKRGQNRRNGKTRKTVKSSYGSFELETPRDRAGSFEPQLVSKRQTTLNDEIDAKVLSLYSMGMSYGDISSWLQEMYGVEMSKGTLTAITDKVNTEVTEWQTRPLESVYPFLWLDAIHFKVKEDGRYISKAVYCVIGFTMEGQKEVLGMYIGENETSRFWLEVLTDLQQRGVTDILIACIDNLTGFKEAIQSIYSQTEVQLCIVHQVRNSLRYVASADQKEFMRDLKEVYRAASKSSAEARLEALNDKWGSKYPMVIRSWKNNWPELSNYFSYAEDIRRIIYTTNPIESYHRQLRKVTKTKGVFPNDKALLKLLYLAQQRISAKWNMPARNWALTLSQLAIMFEDRVPLKL